jgi:hypothetical protein
MKFSSETKGCVEFHSEVGHLTLYSDPTEYLQFHSVTKGYVHFHEMVHDCIVGRMFRIAILYLNEIIMNLTLSIAHCPRRIDDGIR